MIQFLARILLRILFRLEVHGTPPSTKPERLLVVPNHQAFTDGLLAQAFLPIQVTWIVHSQIVAKWYFRFLLRGIPHLAVDAANPMSMKKVVHLIESGTPVGIFPEGRITDTGELYPFRSGITRIVGRTPVPVVPLALRGLWGSFFSRKDGPAMSRPLRRGLFSHIELVVGEAVPPEAATPAALQAIVAGLRGERR